MKKNKRDKLIRYTFILGLLLVILGTSYALFSMVLVGNKKIKIKSGNISLQLLDKNGNSIEKNENNQYEYQINIDKVTPITDENGYDSTPFIFKVKNNGETSVEYKLYLDDFALSSGEERIADKYVKFALKENGLGGGALLLTATGSNPNRKLDMQILDPNEEKEYELRIWVDEDATTEAAEKVFDAVIRVDGVQYINNIKLEKDSFAEILVNKGIKDKLTYVKNGFDSDNEVSGLYEYKDKDGTSTYVFRGTNVNNYVTFAGSTWRVLRIQKNGTVKLIKEDPLNFESSLATDAGSYKEVQYNSDSSVDEASKYAGSNVKAYIDEWYISTMQEYDNKIETNAYCSDRSQSESSVFDKVVSGYKIYGVLNFLNFPGVLEGEYTEEQINKAMWKPSVSCNNNDKVNTKSALMTADEYILAGSAFIKEVNNYLRKEYDEWMMSPAMFAADDAGVCGGQNGYIMVEMVDSRMAVRPVITLKANITVSSGNGTSGSPYVIN